MARLEERDRVRDHTPASVNARIDEATRASIAQYAGDPDGAIQRLARLDREWDVDRALMIAFPVLGGATLLAGLERARARANPFLVLLGVQMGFLAWHAVVGWCPPMALLRRLGFRTEKEIAEERIALLRGPQGEQVEPPPLPLG